MKEEWTVTTEDTMNTFELERLAAWTSNGTAICACGTTQHKAWSHLADMGLAVRVYDSVGRRFMFRISARGIEAVKAR